MLHFCTLELVEYILIVHCQIFIKVAVLDRLSWLNSQYFSRAVLALKKVVPFSRVDTSELAVREGNGPARVVELRDLVLEEAAVLVGRVQGRVVLVLGRVRVAHVDECIRVLATWCQEHALDVVSSGILLELVRTMEFSSHLPMEHRHQWLSFHIRYLSSTRLSL